MVLHCCKKLKIQINGKTFFACGSEDLISLKCPYYREWSTDFIQSIKITMVYLAEIEENSKIHMESQRASAKTILGKM